jgi:alpha-D-ribose 1-methylphosphonate 5-triphosphate synthase subunit PhnI
VRGGLNAVRAAEELVRWKRQQGGELPLDLISAKLRLAVDRVQAEGGLLAPELAARALRQTEGDLIEAAQLVRSYRSTLPRLGWSEPVSCDELKPVRRIVPAYRTPPGPQVLGRTLDYVGRLIDFADHPAQAPTSAHQGPTFGERLLEVLRRSDLLVERRRTDDPPPDDITLQPLDVPASRSARLSALARGETGALVNLWYQGVRGPKAVFHEITLGEVRHGALPVRVRHPRSGRAVEVGSIQVTEVEAVEDLDRPGDDRMRFDAGYGLVVGHDERKAIAMAVLDVSIHRQPGGDLEQSVLLTCDGLDANGFLEHLKLPHYVTFRSMVERKERLRAVVESSSHGTAGG